MPKERGTKKKTTSTSRSFQEEWLKEKDFKGWLIKKMSNSDDKSYHAYCSACSVFLQNKKHNITVNMDSSSHQKAMDLFLSKQRQQNSLATFLENPLSKNVTSLELRLCLFVAEHNLALSSAEHILQLFKTELPDNPVLARATIGKTKTSNYMREAVGKFVTDRLADRARRTLFCVIIDESTDISVKNKMALVISFWDGKMNSELLQLARCKDATAEGLTTALLDILKESNIPKTQMVGFSADTCNTMFGENNSVSQRLKQEIPHLVTVKCTCHSSHLCCSKAFAMLPSIIEEFVREVPSYFSGYKKKDTLVEFQEFCQVEIHSILKPGLTRWLTLQPCAARILEQFNPLTLFFTDAVASKPNESNMKILKLLKDPFTKCYLEFLVFVLDKFNKFNATFQSNKPLLFELEDYVNKLVLDLARCYLKGPYVNSQMSCALLLNPSNEEAFLPLRSIYIGGEKANEALDYARQPRSASEPAEKQFFTMFFPKERATAEENARKYALAYLSKHQIQIPAKNAPPSDPVRIKYDRAFQLAFSKEFERSFTPIDYFFASVQKFFITSVSEIQKRFSFKDNVFQILPLVRPKNARNLCPASLSSLFKRFPLLNDHCNVVEAEKEWRSHVNMPIDYFEIDSSQSTFAFYNMDVEFYWNRVFAAKLPSGEPQFPNLKVCISLLLSLPFSNASAERFFSFMKLTKTPIRNALHDKSVSALLKANNWLKNGGSTAGKVEIPEDLINLAKKVKTNAAIQDSESDSD